MFEDFVPASGNSWDKYLNSFTSGYGNGEPVDTITPGQAIELLPAIGATTEVMDQPTPAPSTDPSLILLDAPFPAPGDITTSGQETQAVDAITGADRVVEQAISLAGNALTKLATDPDFTAKMNLAFGDTWDATVASDLAQDWLTGDFSKIPPVEMRASAEINGANGAFAGENNSIYLSREFVAGNADNPAPVVSVLLEEIGHYIDSQINSSDAAGDEGAIFAGVVQGQEFDAASLQALKAEDDTAIVMLDGKATLIEQAYNGLVKSSPGLTKNIGGWTNNNTYPRVSGDVNGDGKDDIIGFGDTNVFVSLSNGNGTFGAPIASSPGFTKNIGGWTNNNTYPRLSGDVNGDGKDDIVGFGSGKVYVSLSKGNGTFGAPIGSTPSSTNGFTTNVGGWTDNNNYPRVLADVNGDKKADIIGFGARNVFVSLSNGNGTFGAPIASSPGFTKNIGGWTNNNTYPRLSGDVNGDGKDDIVGFGSGKVYVSLSKGNGTFGAPIGSTPSSTNGFTTNVGGWTDNNNYPRVLADVNGDRKDDIVGFGATNVFVSLSNGNGTFGAPTAYSPGLTKNIGGWTDNNNYPRVVGDVNKDGKDDLIGFGDRDVFVSLSGSSSSPPPPPVWENPLPLGSYRVTQEFGSGHTGIDLGANTGIPIEAARIGKVVFVGTDQYGGKYIDIDHGSNLKTRYLHLSTFAVSVGTVVNDDTKIGAVGNTGLSTGPHLHFEVWQNGVRQNPRNYLSF